MKTIPAVCLALLMASCGNNSDSQDPKNIETTETETGIEGTDNSENPNLSEVTPSDTTVTSEPRLVTLTFQPKIDGETVACSTIADSTFASNIRFFVSNLQLIGTSAPVVVDLVLESDYSNLQYLDETGNSLALIKLVDQSCEDEEAQISSMATITFETDIADLTGLSFNLGLPYQPFASELSSVPAPMAPSDMGWMWSHFPANIQMDLRSSGGVNKTFNQLISATKNEISLDLTAETGATEIVIDLNLDKMFDSSADEFVEGMESACFNQTNLPTDASPTCLGAAKALGFTGTQTVFSVSN
ncbi:MAG: hypothetical protein HRU19_06860 [Pseudobacteriovorax sp.]|nr:hypothetical protein [Pseudobacteriovorax sp.]